MQPNSAAQHAAQQRTQHWLQLDTNDINQADLQHDSVHDVGELVSGALGQEGDVGPCISQHKLLGGRQAAVEAVDEGAQEAHPLQAQHHQTQSQPAPHHILQRQTVDLWILRREHSRGEPL